MEKEPTLSFIIVTYKSANHLERCLQSILNRIINISKEIIIVSNDDVFFNFSEAKIIKTEKNIGFGGACNLGVKSASGEYLCFLNPDTEIISEDFIKIISEFKNNKKTGIIGPKLINENGEIQEWSAGKEVNLLDIIGNNLKYKRSKEIWESMKKTECAWVSGACLFIKKELFEKLNGFDENFFLYFEDIDLCKRARNLDHKVIYFPELIIKHFSGKSFDSKKEQKKYYYSSQDYYFQKHFGKITANLLKLIRSLSPIK